MTTSKASDGGSRPGRGRGFRILRDAAVLAAVTGTALTGCSSMDGNSEKDPGSSLRTREVEAAREDAKSVSSQLLNVLGLSGKVTEPGPGVSPCEDSSSDTRFTIKHPWSVYDVPVPDMEAAMERLRDGLPERGWEIVSYGPDKSPARNLRLIADYEHGDKQFSVNVRLLDERGKDNGQTSMINVSLVSACFQVPEGKKVEGF
jgi:hypothetical protein